jgi:rhamnose transport system permease protein
LKTAPTGFRPGRNAHQALEKIRKNLRAGKCEIYDADLAHLPSLAVTIGTLALFRGFAYIALGDTAVADYPPEYAQFGLGVIHYTFIPSPFVLFIVLVLAFLGSASSHHGRPESLRDRGNQIAARFSGVDISRLKMLLFIASAVISALAGIIFTFRFSSSRADNGTGFELSAIAAVFLGGVTVQGGKGTVIGVVLSLLLIGIINNVLTLADVASEILRIVTGSLLIISILLPNLIASAHEKWQLMQRQREISRLGGASVPE